MKKTKEIQYETCGHFFKSIISFFKSEERLIQKCMIYNGSETVGNSSFELACKLTIKGNKSRQLGIYVILNYIYIGHKPDTHSGLVDYSAVKHEFLNFLTKFW